MEAAFASVAMHGVKPYVWSGTTDKDGPSRGLTPGNEDSYSPKNASTQVFDMQFLKIDSDKAFEVAQQHGGDKLLAKTPDMPVFYLPRLGPEREQAGMARDVWRGQRRCETANRRRCDYRKLLAGGEIRLKSR